MPKTIQLLKKSLVFLLIVSGKSAFAQFVPVNTIDINTTYIPETKYKQKDGNVENQEKTQKRIDFGYSFLIASKIDTTTKRMSRWTGTFGGSYTQFTSKSSDKDLIPNRLLNSQFGVSYFHVMKNNWAMVNILSAGINSDLEKINYHSLYINGGILFIKTYSPSLSVGLGGFVVNALNTPILLPGIILRIQTEGKFKYNINLPTEVSTAYEMTSKMELKLAFRLRTMSYDTYNAVDPKRRYLTYSEFPLGLESKWKSKHFDFMLGSGYVFARNFTFKESGIKNLFKKEPANRLSGNVFVSAGIRYRLQTAKN